MEIVPGYLPVYCITGIPQFEYDAQGWHKSLQKSALAFLKLLDKSSLPSKLPDLYLRNYNSSSCTLTPAGKLLPAQRLPSNPKCTQLLTKFVLGMTFSPQQGNTSSCSTQQFSLSRGLWGQSLGIINQAKWFNYLPPPHLHTSRDLGTIPSDTTNRKHYLPK